jgi:2-amino-4-hydroxy-6-hydroxymethyldihydropteridine diphosphokinase
MHRFHLSLGSNLEPEKHLRAALQELRGCFGEIQVSSVYETAAVGFEGPPFWNLAVGLHADLDAETLNDWLHALEAREGRLRGDARYADRTLDIDIVAVDGRALERPELHEAFVLAPLCEIAPEVRIPRGKVTVCESWARLRQAGGDMPRRIRPL